MKTAINISGVNMPISVNLLIMKYTQITSASNFKIKEALDIKNRRSKYKYTAFIIEGPHLVETALASGNKINTAFFTDSFRAKKMGRRY